MTLEAAPQRVAALTGSYADIWCTAGGKDTLIASASDAWTDFDLGLAEDVANIGGAMGVSVEELLASAPDLVLASTNISSNQEMLPTLEAARIKVAFFSVDTFEDYLRMLEICTTLTGCPENYQTYGEAVAEEIEAARAPRCRYSGAAGAREHPLYPGGGLGGQAQGQRRHRAGRDAGRSGLRQHRRPGRKSFGRFEHGGHSGG